MVHGAWCVVLTVVQAWCAAVRGANRDVLWCAVVAMVQTWCSVVHVVWYAVVHGIMGRMWCAVVAVVCKNRSVVRCGAWHI